MGYSQFGEDLILAHLFSQIGISKPTYLDIGANEPKFICNTLLLDYQSRTSVFLLRILLKDHWGINPILVDSSAGYQILITGTTAGLVIGDRALEQRNKSKYNYDLGLAWKELTGLPFVFAVWVSNKPMEEQFIEKFNMSNALGISQINDVVNESAFFTFDLKLYYSKYIQYCIDASKRIGMDEFLAKIDKVVNY